MLSQLCSLCYLDSSWRPGIDRRYMFTGTFHSELQLRAAELYSCCHRSTYVSISAQLLISARSPHIRIVENIVLVSRDSQRRLMCYAGYERCVWRVSVYVDYMFRVCCSYAIALSSSTVHLFTQWKCTGCIIRVPKK